MSNHRIFRCAISVIMVLSLLLSFCSMPAYAQEEVISVSFLIEKEAYSVEMKFEGDQLYCRADQWAEAAGCLWVFNSEQQKVLFYYEGPTILVFYNNETYIKDGENLWVPFFDIATQTGVCFSEVSGNTIRGYRVTPLAVIYKDMDRMFNISQYRISEMLLELDEKWVLLDSAARAYAILSSFSLKGFLDAVSGKMDQDMYDAILLDMLRTDETLLGAITGAGEEIERSGKIINLLQKSLDEDGALVELLEQMDFSESDIRKIVWDLSQEAYGNKTLNDLSDLYEANNTTHFLEMLKFIDDMTVSLEADIHSVMAMQEVFLNSDNVYMCQAAQKAIGARVGNKTLTAGMYSLEFLGDVFLDQTVDKLDDLCKEAAGTTSLSELGGRAFVWALDKALSLTETTDAIMYSDVYSLVQLELVNYYYRHRNDTASDNGLMMHSVALLYLRACLASWKMYEFDDALSQSIDNAASMLTAEITNLMQYTEEELLQNGTKKETVQAILELVEDIRANSSVENGQNTSNLLLKDSIAAQKIVSMVEYGVLLGALDDSGIKDMTWDLADGNGDGVDELYIEGDGGSSRYSQLFYDAKTNYLWNYTETGAAQSTCWVSFSGENAFVHRNTYGSAAYQMSSFTAWHENGWDNFAKYTCSWSNSINNFSGEAEWYGENVTLETFKEKEEDAVFFCEMKNPDLMHFEVNQSAEQVCVVLDEHFRNWPGMLYALVQDLDGDGVMEHLYLVDGAANRILEKMDVENAQGEEYHLNYEDDALTIISVADYGSHTGIEIVRSKHYDLSGGSIRLYDDLVTIERILCTCNWDSDVWSFEIPQINLESAEIDAINAKIMSDYAELIHDCDLSSSDDYLPYYYLGCDYTLEGDILSLIIEGWFSDSDGSDYSIYNISLSQKAPVDNEMLITAAGMTEEEYRTHVKRALGAECWRSIDFHRELNPEDYSLEEWFMLDEMLQNTICAENVDAARPFLGENGDLWVVGHVYVPAGGGVISITVNLNDYEIPPNYAESLAFEKPEEQMRIELSWNGRDSDGYMMSLDTNFSGIMDDGSWVEIDDWSVTYDKRGRPVAYCNGDYRKGSIVYHLYHLDGIFDFEVSVSEDIADFIGNISESGAKAIVTYPDGRTFTYTLDEGVYQSYTAHWFWAPFSIDHGALVDYDASWIQDASNS